MKSLCIKTNNDKIIDYLFNKFENINLVETYITIKEFKISCFEQFSNID